MNLSGQTHPTQTPHTDTHRHRHRHTHRYIQTHRHRHTHRHTDTHIHTTLPAICAPAAVLCCRAAVAFFQTKRYPHLVRGAISTSSPVEAQTDFHQYHDVVGKSLATAPQNGTRCRQCWSTNELLLRVCVCVCVRVRACVRVRTRRRRKHTPSLLLSHSFFLTPSFSLLLSLSPFSLSPLLSSPLSLSFFLSR